MRLQNKFKETLEAFPLQLHCLTVVGESIPIDMMSWLCIHRPPELDRLVLCPDLKVLDLDIAWIDQYGGNNQRVGSLLSSSSFLSSSTTSMKTSFSVQDIRHPHFRLKTQIDLHFDLLINGSAVKLCSNHSPTVRSELSTV